MIEVEPLIDMALLIGYDVRLHIKQGVFSLLNHPMRNSELAELLDFVDYGFDGRTALAKIIQSSSYRTLPQAVASLTLFSHPLTVAQIGNQNLYLIVRSADKRGGLTPSGNAMYDDNTSPTDAFLWANRLSRSKLQSVQYNHVWRNSNDVEFYTNLANICVTPAFLAKLTDGRDECALLLRYRAYTLYGFKPTNEAIPSKPEGYDDLQWAVPLPPTEDVEAALRKKMKANTKNRAVLSVSQLGWYFSNYQPEKC